MHHIGKLANVTVIPMVILTYFCLPMVWRRLSPQVDHWKSYPSSFSPVKISRPEVFQKKLMKEYFEVYISNFLDELEASDLKLKKVIVDAPNVLSADSRKCMVDTSVVICAPSTP